MAKECFPAPGLCSTSALLLEDEARRIAGGEKNTSCFTSRRKSEYDENNSIEEEHSETEYVSLDDGHSSSRQHQQHRQEQHSNKEESASVYSLRPARLLSQHNNNLFLPLAVGITSVSVILLFVMPFTALIIIPCFIWMLLCVAFCWGRVPTGAIPRLLEHPHIVIFSKARQARKDVQSQPPSGAAGGGGGGGVEEEREETAGTATYNRTSTPVDWTLASGVYASCERPQGSCRIDLQFSGFHRSIFSTLRRQNNTNNTKKSNKTRVWSIRGKSSHDDSFQILQGLVAENGKFYWLEKHTGSGAAVTSSSTRRLVLVEGVMDFDTHRLDATWTDNMGCAGAYVSLERQEQQQQASMMMIPLGGGEAQQQQ